MAVCAVGAHIVRNVARDDVAPLVPAGGGAVAVGHAGIKSDKSKN